MQFWVVQTKLLELISTKKRLTKPLIAVLQRINKVVTVSHCHFNGHTCK